MSEGVACRMLSGPLHRFHHSRLYSIGIHPDDAAGNQQRANWALQAREELAAEVLVSDLDPGLVPAWPPHTHTAD